MLRMILVASMTFACFSGTRLQATENNEKVQQVCLSEDGVNSSCFLEVIKSGRSELFTTEQALPYLSLNEVVINANAEFVTLDDTSYTAKIRELQPSTYMLSPQRFDQFDYESIQNCAQNEEKKEGGAWKDWGKCTAGTVGGGITGGLAGAVGVGGLGLGIGALAGPGVAAIGGIGGAIVGGISGTVGGALTGAAASCGYSFHIHYKGTSYDVTENRYIPGQRCF